MVTVADTVSVESVIKEARNRFCGICCGGKITRRFPKSIFHHLSRSAGIGRNHGKHLTGFQHGRRTFNSKSGQNFSLGHTGAATAEEAAKKLYDTYHPEVVVITQGKRGGIIYDGKEIVSYPIYPAVVVDSNGSGDVFHGAFAAAVCKGYGYLKCCHFSSAVSGLKCTGVGARESVPSFETVKEYMKENGYEL